VYRLCAFEYNYPNAVQATVIALDGPDATKGERAAERASHLNGAGRLPPNVRTPASPAGRQKSTNSKSPTETRRVYGVNTTSATVSGAGCAFGAKRRTIVAEVIPLPERVTDTRAWCVSGGVGTALFGPMRSTAIW
jgi:hypothetical protein